MVGCPSCNDSRFFRVTSPHLNWTYWHTSGEMGAVGEPGFSCYFYQNPRTVPLRGCKWIACLLYQSTRQTITGGLCFLLFLSFMSLVIQFQVTVMSCFSSWVTKITTTISQVPSCCEGSEDVNLTFFLCNLKTSVLSQSFQGRKYLCL